MKAHNTHPKTNTTPADARSSKRTAVSYIFRAVGLLGALVFIVSIVRHPTWPTPDKLFVFLVLVFMMFGQGWGVFKRLGPFVALLLVYEQFRSVVPELNKHVNFMFMPDADRFLFRTDPTHALQNVLWHGHVQWYDFFLYGFYMLHFVLPIVLALVVWKLFEKDYWRYVCAYLTVSFSGFITFLLFPAAPPWMASEKGYIAPITRVSSYVWERLGITDFPSFYNHLSPNPVAAMPSLHAAYATLFCMFIYRFFGKKWALLAAIYPLSIYFGTVYQGEHYVIDEIAGALYAVGAYFAAPYVLRGIRYLARQVRQGIKWLYLRLVSRVHVRVQ